VVSLLRAEVALFASEGGLKVACGRVWVGYSEVIHSRAHSASIAQLAFVPGGEGCRQGGIAASWARVCAEGARGTVGRGAARCCACLNIGICAGSVCDRQGGQSRSSCTREDVGPVGEHLLGVSEASCWAVGARRTEVRACRSLKAVGPGGASDTSRGLRCSTRGLVRPSRAGELRRPPGPKGAVVALRTSQLFEVNVHATVFPSSAGSAVESSRARCARGGCGCPVNGAGVGVGADGAWLHCVASRELVLDVAEEAVWAGRGSNCVPVGIEAITRRCCRTVWTEGTRSARSAWRGCLVCKRCRVRIRACETLRGRLVGRPLPAIALRDGCAGLRICPVKAKRAYFTGVRPSSRLNEALAAFEAGLVSHWAGRACYTGSASGAASRRPCSAWARFHEGSAGTSLHAPPARRADEGDSCTLGRVEAVKEGRHRVPVLALLVGGALSAEGLASERVSAGWTVLEDGLPSEGALEAFRARMALAVASPGEASSCAGVGVVDCRTGAAVACRAGVAVVVPSSRIEAGWARHRARRVPCVACRSSGAICAGSRARVRNLSSRTSSWSAVY